MTAPYYTDDLVTVHHGDCLDVLRTLPDASVDAVVTDPPYGLEFMGKEWDAPWRASDVGRGVRVAAERAAEMTPTGRGHSTPGGPFLAARVDSVRVAGLPFQQWCEQWARECLRVLKPGGHLAAFGGTRTYHRLACAIEDAGFEVRDCLAWLYAQGFPKSMNVGKDPRFCQCAMGEWAYESGGPTSTEHDVRALLDADVPPPVPAPSGPGALLLAGVSEQGAPGDGAVPGEGPAVVTQPRVERRRDAQAPAGQLSGRAVRPVPGGVTVDGTGGRLRDGAQASDGPMDRPSAAPVGSGQPRQPRPVGQPSGEPRPLADERRSQARRGWPLCGGCGKPRAVGVGTALKPAHEPIVLARKPLAGTVAANVLTHGTGALNIDGCRVPADPEPRKTPPKERASREDWRFGAGTGTTPENGRWPANVVLDDHAAAELDRQSGTLTSGANPTRRGSDKFRDAYGEFAGQEECVAHRGADSGGASRFFPVFRYEAKAPVAERPKVRGAASEERLGGQTTTRCTACGKQRVNVGSSACTCPEPTFVRERSADVTHPTVKPLDLMRWLVRLITPPGGIVLDPFLGSGTTAEACVIEGFRCIGVEREPDYLPLIRARLSKPIAPVLFGDDVA